MRKLAKYVTQTDDMFPSLSVSRPIVEGVVFSHRATLRVLGIRRSRTRF